MIRLTISFALLFEIPIIIMFLTSLGIITPQFLRKMRKYAYFILLIVGALVTPPDVILQLTVAIPLFILYEIDRKSTRLNSSHVAISYAVFCLKKKKKKKAEI